MVVTAVPVPRVILIRHGETLWTMSGQHTGQTDLTLTPDGERRVEATAKALIGAGRPIALERIASIYVSPRKRAQQTLELLGFRVENANLLEQVLPETKDGSSLPVTFSGNSVFKAPLHIDERVREWDYGEYEGLTKSQIYAKREAKGLDRDRKWDIWLDGCEGGESPQEISDRVDEIINEIRENYHLPHLRAEKAGTDVGEIPPADVVVVAHGHLLRVFANRWVQSDLAHNLPFVMETGGVAALSYTSPTMQTPALVLGSSFRGAPREK